MQGNVTNLLAKKGDMIRQVSEIKIGDEEQKSMADRVKQEVIHGWMRHPYIKTVQKRRKSERKKPAIG